jgi:hypothetical protein
MRRPVAFAVFLSWASVASADPTLIGQWTSDRDASAAFNEEHVRFQAKTAAFLKDAMGRLVVSFSSYIVSYDLPNFTTSIEGKEFSISGYSETHPYTVVASTPNSVAIRTIEPVSHQPVVVVYNFVSPDSVWIYAGNSGSHVREYFKRVEAK